LIEILEHSVAAEATAYPNSDVLVTTPTRIRVVPILLIVVVVVSTMAYSLLWGPLVLHRPDWIVKSDIWGTLRTSQFVAWGNIGGVYSSGGGLVSLPGISVALAPVALLVNHLGLLTSFPFGIPHPTAWLVLGPYEAAIGALVLVPLDSLAEELGVGRRARLVSTICEAAVLWPVVAIWGHPEDPLAMAFAVWGLVAALRGRWRAVGWLWGLALVMQPLVVLMFPIVFAMAPRRQRLSLALRSALPSAVLVAIPLIQSWGPTTKALLKQPNFPAIDHATPWMSLAPVLSRSHPVAAGHVSESTLPDGTRHFTMSVVHSISGEAVAAGPGRLIAMGLAVLLGIYVFRHRPSREQVIWLCLVALSLRCVFEAVMNPYYLWPPLAIGLVLAARSRWRFALTVSTSVVLTWWSYRYLGPWAWWAPIVTMLGLVLAAASPVRPSAREATNRSEGWSTDSSPSAVEALV